MWLPDSMCCTQQSMPVFFSVHVCNYTAITQHGQLRSPWLVVMCIFQKQSSSHDEVCDPLATTVVKNAISACQNDSPTRAVSRWYYA